MLLGAVLTGSRAGIALVPLALAWCFTLQPLRLPADSSLRRWSVPVLGVIAVASLTVAALQSRSIGRVLARFDFTGEYRPDIWRDTVHAIGQYWPMGSGMGTFTRVIGPAERLEAIGPTLPNRAHNEYLELLLEAGLPGALAWAAIIAFVIVGLRKALRAAGSKGLPQAVFTGGALTIVTLHSLLDYPLRSMALAGLVGVAAAFVLAPPKVRDL
jgi:O-antigen ligase